MIHLYLVKPMWLTLAQWLYLLRSHEPQLYAILVYILSVARHF